MYYSRKKTEEILLEATVIWSCTKQDCNGWIRDDFAFAMVPTCHQCNSPMIRSMSELPVLVNTREDQKSLKNGIAIGKK